MISLFLSTLKMLLILSSHNTICYVSDKKNDNSKLLFTIDSEIKFKLSSGGLGVLLKDVLNKFSCDTFYHKKIRDLFFEFCKKNIPIVTEMHNYDNKSKILFINNEQRDAHEEQVLFIFNNQIVPPNSNDLHSFSLLEPVIKTYLSNLIYYIVQYRTSPENIANTKKDIMNFFTIIDIFDIENRDTFFKRIINKNIAIIAEQFTEKNNNSNVIDNFMRQRKAILDYLSKFNDIFIDEYIKKMIKNYINIEKFYLDCIDNIGRANDIKQMCQLYFYVEDNKLFTDKNKDYYDTCFIFFLTHFLPTMYTVYNNNLLALEIAEQDQQSVELIVLQNNFENALQDKLNLLKEENKQISYELYKQTRKQIKGGFIMQLQDIKSIRDIRKKKNDELTLIYKKVKDEVLAGIISSCKHKTFLIKNKQFVDDKLMKAIYICMFKYAFEDPDSLEGTIINHIEKALEIIEKLKEEVK